MSELWKRIIVAVIGIPAAIAIIYAGGYIFLIAVMLLSSMALWEYYSMAEKKGSRPDKIIGIFAGAIIQYSFFEFYSSSYPWISVTLILMTFIVFSLITLLSQMFSRKAESMHGFSTTLSGVIYISLLMLTLTGLREINSLSPILLENGLSDFNFLSGDAISRNTQAAWLILAMFVSVWVCDSAAYFTGRAIGRHKLFPSVSPKKTWEGAIGGFFGGIIGFTAVTYFLVPDMPIIHSVICGAIAGSFGQVGDLAESMLKRDAGVKDSSSLLPGHGGILDRFDSVLFTAPAIYFYLLLITVLTEM